MEVETNRIREGAAYVAVAAFLFAAAPAMARSAASDLNVLILVFWTNVWMFLLMCIWVRLCPPPGGIATTRLRLHALRSIFTYGAIVAYFFAVTRIPFANAVILQSMGPLLVPILAFVIFRRLSDRYVWLGVAVSFVGVLLIVRPNSVGISLGELSAILAALGGAAAALIIWFLGTTDPPDRQMFYFTLFALLLSALSLPWAWQWPTLPQLAQVFLIAVFTLAGQFFYAKAFAIAPGDKVNTWIYMSLVFAALIGFVFWGEPILPLTVVGGTLVVAGAYFATRE